MAWIFWIFIYSNENIERCIYKTLRMRKSPRLLFSRSASYFWGLLSSHFKSRWQTCSFKTHLEERDPIWGDDWTQSPFIRRSPSWGFLGFSSTVKQMPGDLCTASKIISLSPLSLATDETDVTFGASGLWIGTRTGAGGTAALTESFFRPQPMAPWATGSFEKRETTSTCSFTRIKPLFFLLV